MNHALRLATALLALAGTASALAQTAGASGDTLYRRYLAGDPSIDRSTATASAATPLPGPQAQHLIYLGVDTGVAIERSRALGEQPRTPAAMPSSAPAARGYDLYARNAMAASERQQGPSPVMR